MGTFGLQLRQAREARGVRLIDAARATKIPAPDLAALEYQDLDVLPEDEETLTGYVRRYAEYLGLEAGPLADECADALEARRPKTPAAAGGEAVGPPGAAVASGPRRFAHWVVVVAGVLVVILALVAWWWLGAGDSRGGPTGGEDPPGEEILPAEPPAPPPGGETGAPRSGLADEPPAGTEAASAGSGPGPPPHGPDPPSAASRLRVEEHGVGTGVVDRRLVGAADRFGEGTRVWFWTLVRGGRAGDRIVHVWTRDGQVTSRVPLEVGGPHWRTQSRKMLKPGSRGRWVVEARDEAGNVLARSSFECFTP